MKIALLSALVLLAIGGLDRPFAQEKTTKHPERKDLTGVADGDKAMAAAMEKARENLMTFVKALQDREDGKRYLLKVKIEHDGTVEHVWLEPVKWKDPGLVGILAVDPVAITKHEKGDMIAPLPGDVSDWVILSEDGTKQGGFTMDVLEKRREEAESKGQSAERKD